MMGRQQQRPGADRRLQGSFGENLTPMRLPVHQTKNKAPPVQRVKRVTLAAGQLLGQGIQEGGCGGAGWGGVRWGEVRWVRWGALLHRMRRHSSPRTLNQLGDPCPTARAHRTHPPPDTPPPTAARAAPPARAARRPAGRAHTPKGCSAQTCLPAGVGSRGRGGGEAWAGAPLAWLGEQWGGGLQRSKMQPRSRPLARRPASPAPKHSKARQARGAPMMLPHTRRSSRAG